VAAFTSETDAQNVGATFLKIISWNFIAQGVVFTCSGMFQGLGNTKPALLSSALRLAIFVPLAIVLTREPGYTLAHVWELSVLSVLIQAVFSYLLLRSQFRRRLAPQPAL
jgi:Na+-driven multidrug efflux pump